MDRDAVYQIFTDRVVKTLEEGTVPWRKPWNATTDGPRNIEGRTYRGLNTFLLLSAGYDSPYWMTLKQINARGWKVRLKESPTPVVFWKMLAVKDKDDPAARSKTIPLLRYYKVWNLEQSDGINPPVVETVAATFTPVEAAEKVIANYPGGPPITHGGSRAFYRPATDEITLPEKDTFATPDGYYSTAFHELGHSTGAEKRLARKNWAGFGSHEYGREELVAEMTAAFLSGETGILPNTIDNSAAYLRSWIRTIGEDVRAVVWAAGQAQRAADHILGRVDSYEAKKDDSGS